MGGTNECRPIRPTRSATWARSSNATREGACLRPHDRQTASGRSARNNLGPAAGPVRLPHKPQESVETVASSLIVKVAMSVAWSKVRSGGLGHFAKAIIGRRVVPTCPASGKNPLPRGFRGMVGLVPQMVPHKPRGKETAKRRTGKARRRLHKDCRLGKRGERRVSGWRPARGSVPPAGRGTL